MEPIQNYFIQDGRATWLFMVSALGPALLIFANVAFFHYQYDRKTIPWWIWAWGYASGVLTGLWMLGMALTSIYAGR